MTDARTYGGTVDQAVEAVVGAAVVEAQQQAEVLAGSAHAGRALPTGLVGRSDLINLHLQARAGLDVGREVALLRRQGVTWAQIGAATGMARQSAHERWSETVAMILDRYGTGELAERAEPDPA